MDYDKILKNTVTNKGISLYDISHEAPVLLVFLRQLNCVFCRDAMTTLGEMQRSFAERNIELVLVHMSEKNVAQQHFAKFDLQHNHHISDINCDLYTQFGLVKGSANQLLGFKNIIRGFDIASSRGIFPRIRQIGDGFQMPGVFVIKKGEIKDSYIHKLASDIPDYDRLLNCCMA